MPFAQCADGAANGTVRDIAVLTRVGRPTCFVIEALDTDENGQPFYRLSRALRRSRCARPTIWTPCSPAISCPAP